MLKTMTAGVLALSLSLTSLTATPARAELTDDQAVVGLLTLLLIGAAVANNRNDDNRDRDRGSRRERWRELPAECLTTVNTRGGEVRMFGRRCMVNNYDHVNRLPDRCEITVRNRRGNMRHGYVPRCLRQSGFHVEGRRDR